MGVKADRELNLPAMQKRLLNDFMKIINFVGETMSFNFNNKSLRYMGMILLGFSLTNSVQAASSGIRSNKTNECAIWICLPGGFPGSAECQASQAAYIKRLTDFTSGKHPKRKFTSLPSFSDNCNDTAGVTTVDGQYYPNNVQMTYEERQDAHVPAHDECTNIVPVYKRVRDSDGNYEKRLIGYRCDAWTSVPEQYVENTRCNLGTTRSYISDFGDDETGYLHGRLYRDSLFMYSLDGEKLKSYSSPEWCDHTVTTTIEYADGTQVGNLYRQVHD